MDSGDEWFWCSEDAQRVEMLAGKKRSDELRATAGSFIERNVVPLVSGKGLQENRGVCRNTAEY